MSDLVEADEAVGDTSSCAIGAVLFDCSILFFLSLSQSSIPPYSIVAVYLNSKSKCKVVVVFYEFNK